MPFRRRRAHVSVPGPEQYIAAPLAKLEQRLMTASSSLDDLAADLGNVASMIREMAEQVADRAGGGCDA